MSTRTTLSAVAAWSLLALAGPGSAQEVNSDVKIPTPQGGRDVPSRYSTGSRPTRPPYSPCRARYFRAWSLKPRRAS